MDIWNLVRPSCFPSWRRLAFFILVIFMLCEILLGCSSSKTNSRQATSSISAFNERQSQLRVSPEDTQRYNVALKKMSENKLSEAKDLLQQITKDNPDLTGPYINLGIIALHSGDYLEAEDFFQAAVKSRPDNASIYNYLGVVYRQQGRFLDAKSAYEKSLSLDATSSNTYLNLGILNDLYLGNYDEAKKNYQMYQSMHPENKKVAAWLADLGNRMQVSAE